ncbi:hypothetical protein CIY_27110 [Butyrivibrio fibrisolvens 16/4]|nr:hypothetical protein CIY_27110 [Butyrivibrio fibrisolvens 16/4]
MVNQKGYNRTKSTVDVSKEINKLYDHVNLEIARISYVDSINWKTSGEERFTRVESQMRELSSTTKDNLGKMLDDVEHQINSQKDKIDKQQRDYIAILGIFAAIVLAFTTGIAFSTSVLNNINCVSSYRLMAVSLIVGIVLVNVMYGLFYYIDRLVIKASSKTIKPLLFTNIVLLSLLLAVTISWHKGLIETRNMKFEKTQEVIVEEKLQQTQNS